MKIKTPFSKISITALLVATLVACDSTSSTPSYSETVLNDQFQASDLEMLEKTVTILQGYNLSKTAWQDNIESYAKQQNIGSNARYLDYSNILHNMTPTQRCMSSGIRAIQNALVNHPSSLPALSYALNCAERFEQNEQQTIIANSIGIVAEHLLAASGNGSEQSAPILVREMYEGEYLLQLAGVEVFETEMWIEEQRLLILHHGIDQISNKYTLVYADQSDFFFHSLSASFASAGIGAAPSRSALVNLKSKALRDGSHFSMVLWDIRQQLYAGQYTEVIQQISANNYNTPAALSMLVQAYLAIDEPAKVIENQDNVLLYAELGIPESQVIAAILLLRMNDANGTRFERKLNTASPIDLAQDLALVRSSFEEAVNNLGLQSASLLWTRTLLGDPDLSNYLAAIVSTLPPRYLEAWLSALNYIDSTSIHRSTHITKQLSDFKRILTLANDQALVANKGIL